MLCACSYSTGKNYIFEHKLVSFDVGVILLSFLASLLSSIGLISRLFSLVVIARLVQVSMSISGGVGAVRVWAERCCCRCCP